MKRILATCMTFLLIFATASGCGVNYPEEIGRSQNSSPKDKIGTQSLPNLQSEDKTKQPESLDNQRLPQVQGVSKDITEEQTSSKSRQ